MHPTDYFILEGEYHHFEISDRAILNIGKEVRFRSFTSVEIMSTGGMKFGSNVFFNDHCTIRCHEILTIGKDTMFGDGCRLFDQNHFYSNYHIETNIFNSAPITIGKNCWFGANCVILKGVTIGDNVIVGAGCVIYKDIPSNSIVTAGQELTIKPRPQAKYHAFTLTLSANIEHLELLAGKLPEVDFHIVAPTNVSESLFQMNSYRNIIVYPNVSRQERIQEFAKLCDFYLDINHLWESHNVLDYILEMGKPIFAFDNVVKRQDNTDFIVSHDNPDQMVAFIKDFLGLPYK